MKKDKFNFIPETEANMDEATYLRNLEFSATGKPSMTVNPQAFVVEIESADGSKKKVYNYVTDSFQNANGSTVKKVTRTTEPDGLFLGIIDWTGVNEKAARWGVLAVLIYLDAQYQEFFKIDKLSHPDVKKYLELWDATISKWKVPIKYRPDKPIPGMITPTEMAKMMKDPGEKWKASSSSDLSKYLKVEMDKAQAANNTELYNELAGFYELSAGFKVPRITAKQVVKGVLTGGLTEAPVRKVVATITTGGLNLTKPGQKLSAKVDAKVEKIEAKADVLAGKVIQKFKTVSLALPRAAFYSLALINIFGICTHLQTIRENGEKGDAGQAKKWNDVRNFWYKIGGSRGKFDTLIKKGSKKKPFLAKVKKKPATTKADGSEETDYLFAVNEAYNNVVGVDDAAIAAWIGIATSVIVAVKNIAGKPKDMDDESSAALDAEAAANKAEFDALAAQEAANSTPEALRDLDMIMPIWAWGLVGIGAIGAVILIIYAAKHRKK